MWDKLIIALAIAGGSFFGGYKLAQYHGQEALSDCRLARSKDQTQREQANAQRAISNAETITRLRNERDAKEAATRAISRRAAQRDAAARRQLREREQALADALAQGSDCVVPADAVRLLDAAASGAGLPKAPAAGAAAGTPDSAVADAIPAR